MIDLTKMSKLGFGLMRLPRKEDGTIDVDVSGTGKKGFSSDTLVYFGGGVTTIKGSNGITFVPYYAWDNREAGRMKVWIDLN